MAATNRAERHSIFPTSSTTMRSTPGPASRAGRATRWKFSRLTPYFPTRYGAGKVHVAEEGGVAVQGDDLKPQTHAGPPHLPGVKPGGLTRPTGHHLLDHRGLAALGRPGEEDARQFSSSLDLFWGRPMGPYHKSRQHLPQGSPAHPATRKVEGSCRFGGGRQGLLTTKAPSPLPPIIPLPSILPDHGQDPGKQGEGGPGDEEAQEERRWRSRNRPPAQPPR